jgi:DNA-binding NarL/FixJ family response regulator
VVGEDEYLLQEALNRILTRAPEIDVLRFCGDADALLAAVEEEDPDAVLTDIRMPPTFSDEGLRVAEALRTSHPRTGVVILSQFADPEYALALLGDGSGGRAYLLKERIGEASELVGALKAVVAGGSLIDPKVVEALVQSRRVGAQSPLARLTPREHEVLGQLAEGKSNAAIADSLVLTKRAVEKHINSIFFKLDLPGETEVSRRVKAALTFLASDAPTSPR